jgi:hypothetical protein
LNGRTVSNHYRVVREAITKWVQWNYFARNMLFGQPFFYVFVDRVCCHVWDVIKWNAQDVKK